MKRPRKNTKQIYVIKNQILLQDKVISKVSKNEKSVLDRDLKFRKFISGVPLFYGLFVIRSVH